jgi:zinc transport system ATP-binding protein
MKGIDTKMKIIEAKSLSFNYPDKFLINEADFYIDSGEFVCIVGSNGTGKSTLLKLLLNILKPQKGSIHIGGKEVGDFNRYSKVSYVSQKATHFNQDFPATVEEIIKLGIYSKKLNKHEKNAIINEALTKVNMVEYRKKMIGKLSGGQQQRVFIAKALVNNPQIIFLDEPITGIDNHTADSICCLLAELNKDFNITIIMVTHDYHSLRSHASKRITINNDGKVIMENLNMTM